ncbi:MAG: baseplate J/gp47 family protein [Exiguobacterium chiriqhucha]|uniref:baseplate assembly protein n=1 Tax=Exiguobacterium chiriqhucha TaxID=1385984 RepID=UPI001450181F|nr:baseplate J/gp47 family protein [Exiguobacterium chiriqhucha]KAB2864654.1 MAG: baseplate J/gp47 family protein [Exiguobacterium chiriqhucha]
MTRFNLPEIEFVSSDIEEYEQLAVSIFESKMPGVKLNEADPRFKLLQAAAFVASLLANNIDYTGKQSRLAYAEDNYLDHLGNDKGVPRLEMQPAKTTLRFMVSNPELFIIFAGTTVGYSGLSFETLEDVTVPYGITQVDIVAQCTEAGIVGNGIAPGLISNLQSPIPWVQSVTNITESTGGIEVESDEQYAARIHLSPEGYSTAGPEEAYVFHAKTAHQGIIDVKALSPAPSVVKIVVLMRNGELPSVEVLEAVNAKCSPRNVRPLTDFVVVEAPEVVHYDVNITYFLPESYRAAQSYQQSEIQSAVAEYMLWQRSKLGRGIDPGELYARIQSKGGRRILVEPNDYVPINDDQVAKERNVVIQFGGFVDD